MKLYEIKTYPDPILRNPTKPVENIDGNIQEIIDRMEATMRDAPGVGLAANQVGLDLSIVIFDVQQDEESPTLEVLINPVIKEKEGSMVSENEGCLSLPDYRSDVKRASRVLVTALDREGNPLEIEGEDIMAIVLQHEIDHLNGVLFIDHISALKRKLYKRRIRKQMNKDE